MSKPTVTVFPKDGENKDYSVNKNGVLNEWGKQYLRDHGGPAPDIPQDQKVELSEKSYVGYNHNFKNK